MRASQRGLEDIIYSEGEVLHAYSDTLTDAEGKPYKDVLTIGVGHTSAAGPPVVTPGMTITHAQSRDILASDIKAVEERVAKAFGRSVPQTVFDGAVSFDFNTGGILKASWVPLWLAGNMAEAEAHFLQWNKPPEIRTRRKREADLIFRNKYYSPPQPGDLPQPAPPSPPPPDIPKITVPPQVPTPHAPALGAGAATAAIASTQGLPWWGVVLIAAGAVAAVYFISHRKG